MPDYENIKLFNKDNYQSDLGIKSLDEKQYDVPQQTTNHESLATGFNCHKQKGEYNCIFAGYQPSKCHMTMVLQKTHIKRFTIIQKTLYITKQIVNKLTVLNTKLLAVTEI